MTAICANCHTNFRTKKELKESVCGYENAQAMYRNAEANYLSIKASFGTTDEQIATAALKMDKARDALVTQSLVRGGLK